MGGVEEDSSSIVGRGCRGGGGGGGGGDLISMGDDLAVAGAFGNSFGRWRREEEGSACLYVCRWIGREFCIDFDFFAHFCFGRFVWWWMGLILLSERVGQGGGLWIR
jgi:hypothetical protein